MNKKLKTISATILAASISNISYGADTSIATIDYLRVYKENVIITMSEPLTGTSCSDSKYIKVPYNVPGGKELYSAVLSAHMAGRNVAFGVLNTCQTWGGGVSLYLKHSVFILRNKTKYIKQYFV